MIWNLTYFLFLSQHIFRRTRPHHASLNFLLFLLNSKRISFFIRTIQILRFSFKLRGCSKIIVVILTFLKKIGGRLAKWFWPRNLTKRLTNRKMVYCLRGLVPDYGIYFDWFFLKSRSHLRGFYLLGLKIFLKAPKKIRKSLKKVKKTWKKLSTAISGLFLKFLNVYVRISGFFTNFAPFKLFFIVS